MKRKNDSNEETPKLKSKTKKRKKLPFLVDDFHKINLPEKKFFMPNKKKIIFITSKKENANKKSSSKSNEFLSKKTKRNSSH